jgi:hypothetical protein
MIRAFWIYIMTVMLSSDNVAGFCDWPTKTYSVADHSPSYRFKPLILGIERENV